jgi:hypothetical protein
MTEQMEEIFFAGLCWGLFVGALVGGAIVALITMRGNGDD